jgi:hypothetical protein
MEVHWLSNSDVNQVPNFDLPLTLQEGQFDLDLI